MSHQDQIRRRQKMSRPDATKQPVDVIYYDQGAKEKKKEILSRLQHIVDHAHVSSHRSPSELEKQIIAYVEELKGV